MSDPAHDIAECPECGWPGSDLIPDPWDGSLCCPRCLTHIADPVTYPARCSGQHPYHHGADETCPRCSRVDPGRDDMHPEGF